MLLFSALVAIVHLVPNITFEDAKKMVEDTTELGKKCAADKDADPECTKSIVSCWKLDFFNIAELFV